MRTQGGDGHPQAKERGLWRNQPFWHLDIGLPASRLGGNQFLLFKPPSLWHFVTAARANSYTHNSDPRWLRRRWVSPKPTYPEAGKQHSEPFPHLKWDGNTELKTFRGFWDVPKALAPRSSRWFVLLGIRRGRPSVYMGNHLPQREWQAQNGRWEPDPATPISPK